MECNNDLITWDTHLNPPPKSLRDFDSPRGGVNQTVALYYFRWIMWDTHLKPPPKSLCDFDSPRGGVNQTVALFHFRWIMWDTQLNPHQNRYAILTPPEGE